MSQLSSRIKQAGLADLWLLSALAISTLVMGSWSAWQTWGPVEAPQQQATAVSLPSHQPTSPTTISIQDICVGQRVDVGDNPSTERDLRFGEEVIPAEWQKMVLRAPKTSGSDAEVEMLRPTWWLEQRNVHKGGQVDIEVPECGIEGLADVIDVQPCPPMPPGSGRVVTATFHHQAASIVDVAIEGLAEPIGTTPNHPFWSETAQEFVRADQLHPGDQVRTLGGFARVKSVTPRGSPEPVYNLEVQFEHVYRVADLGVLVHNGGIPFCGGPVQIGGGLSGAKAAREADKLARRLHGVSQKAAKGYPNLLHHAGSTPAQLLAGKGGLARLRGAPGGTKPDTLIGKLMNGAVGGDAAARRTLKELNKLL